ncbi:MAG TPA: hypothetical protein VJW75_04610, partial [Candidatus Eisenbacteria bacterium]|nr:hypothetical protein [Candidatus Eisenbacteria bacterium]
MAEQRPEAASRGALSICALLYVAGVIAATASPGPLAWGLHSPGFLPPILRVGTIALLVFGAVLLVYGSIRPGSIPTETEPVKRRGPTPKRGKASAPNRAQLLPLLLLPL